MRRATKESATRDISAIVLAGGHSVRVGGDVPKQFQELAGVPIYQYSLRSLLAAGMEKVILVVPEEFTGQIATAVQAVHPAVRVIKGGSRRQDSVASGFALVEETASIVLIHDAARPFLPLSMTLHVIEAARAHGAALAALPVLDTIKRSRDGAVVSSTVNRTGLFLAQTPQGFKRTILSSIVALETPGIQFTDEAMAAEQIGHMPRLVPGSPFCFKITTRDDLVIAAAALGTLMERGAVHEDWSWLRHSPAR